MEAGGGKEGVSRKDVENNGERTISVWDVETLSPRKKQSKEVSRTVDEEKQAGIRGQWQQESSAGEYLEQVKCSHDTDCNEPMKKKSFTASFDRIKEAFELVAQDEAEKMSMVHEIMLRSTDCLQRIIAPVGGQGGVTMSYLCPHCNSFPLADYVWCLWGKIHEVVVRHLWRKVR